MIKPRYDILHSLGKNKVIVGRTAYNDSLARYLNCEIYSIEDCQSQGSAWLEDCEFLCATSNILFKKQISTQLQVDWFSMIGSSSVVESADNIGRNVFVGDFNYLAASCFINDHCTVSYHCDLNHEVNVGKFCHIGPQCVLAHATFQGECFLGINCCVFAYPKNPISICRDVNLVMDSRVLRSIEKSGTYHGNRRIDGRGSNEKFI
jgi:acetyltransferase-like isoleucine patch superfamily enzyme